jgi:microcystin-dependent protein
MVNTREIINENKSVFAIAIFTAVLISVISANPIPAYASEPFLGEIMFFAGNFAPRNWASCDGQLLPIAQHDALFSLLGTTYGGDGRTTFGIPDMRGRVLMDDGNGPGLSNRPLGAKGGIETVTLTTEQLPTHTHTFPTELQSMTLNAALSVGDSFAPEDKSLGLSFARLYSTNAPAVQLHDSSFSVTIDGSSTANAGGSQSHNNMPPYLTVNCNIALFGIYPSRN